MNNYFHTTPVYKIWIQIMELVIPAFNFLIETKQYRSGDIICNRAGVLFYFLKNDTSLEIIFSHPNKRFYCLTRNSNKEVIRHWNNEIDLGMLTSIEDVNAVLQNLIKEFEKIDNEN